MAPSLAVHAARLRAVPVGVDAADVVSAAACDASIAAGRMWRTVYRPRMDRSGYAAAYAAAEWVLVDTFRAGVGLMGSLHDQMIPARECAVDAVMVAVAVPAVDAAGVAGVDLADVAAAGCVRSLMQPVADLLYRSAAQLVAR
jgi:hypothetical protein